MRGHACTYPGVAVGSLSFRNALLFPLHARCAVGKPPVSARVLCIDREGWGANELDLLAPVYLDLTPVCTGIDEIITKRGQMDADSDYPSSGRKAMAFGA